MRSVLIFTIAIVAVFCLPIFAQNVEYISSTLWTDLGDVDVVGDYAYCAFPNGLGVMDVSDPASPTLVSQLYLHEGAGAIHVDGSYAYVVSGGLKIIDISDPTNPILTGSYETPYAAGHVFVAGDYAYISCSSTLEIVDVSDPSSPAFAGRYEVSAYAISEVFVSGDYAYVTYNIDPFPWSSGSLEIINISDPTNPIFAGSYGMGEWGQASSVYVSGDYAYVTSYFWEDMGFCAGVLDIVNVTDPTNPFLASSYDELNGAQSVFVSGNFAYVSWICLEEDNYHQYGGLKIIDISDPSNPVFASSYGTPGPGRNLFVSGDHAYVADGNLQILDVTDPFYPVFTGSSNSFSRIYNVFVSDSYAYVATGNLQILDVSDPFVPASVGSYDVLGCYYIIVSGDYAYFAHADSLQIVDVSEPSNPVHAGCYEAEHYINAVFVSGDFAFILSALYPSGGLEIIDISDPADPTLSGIYECNRYPEDVFVLGNYAYVTQEFGSFANLLIINITDPTEPTLTGDCSIPGGVAGNVYVEGSYAYIATSSLNIFDVSDPAQPILIGNIGISGYIYDVFVSGDYAYVSYGGINSDGLQIVDVSDPENPDFAGGYDTPGRARGVFVAGDYTYVADAASLMILRFYPETGIEEVINLPDQFSIQQNYPNPFNALTVIKYKLPYQSRVTIDIYDILGRQVGTIQDGMQLAGNHQVLWYAGGQSSGVYFYKLQTGEYSESRKMVLMK